MKWMTICINAEHGTVRTRKRERSMNHSPEIIRDQTIIFDFRVHGTSPALQAGMGAWGIPRCQ